MMKKLLLILTTLALLAAFPAPVSSWYTATLPLHHDMGWQTFSAANMDTQLNGFYTLQNNVFTTSYTGLVKLTGNCTQGKPSNILILLFTDTSATPQIIADTDRSAFTFVVSFVAANVMLQGINNDAGRYDVLKCALLIEKVQ